MRFRVIENPKVMENTEEFIKDYKKGMTFRELSEKYSISCGSVQKKIKRLGLPLRGKGQNPQFRKYYTYHKGQGQYFVSKMINSKNVYYGTYESEVEAKKVVEYLKQHNWDKESLKELVL